MCTYQARHLRRRPPADVLPLYGMQEVRISSGSVTAFRSASRGPVAVLIDLPHSQARRGSGPDSGGCHLTASLGRSMPRAGGAPMVVMFRNQARLQGAAHQASVRLVTGYRPFRAVCWLCGTSESLCTAQSWRAAASPRRVARRCRTRGARRASEWPGRSDCRPVPLSWRRLQYAVRSAATPSLHQRGCSSGCSSPGSR
jgi:hypothetical protein